MSKILVVDDNPSFLEITSRRLSKEGYEVTTCDEPREVPGVILSGEFSMILLDLEMPDFSGEDLLAVLRNTTRFRRTVVILLSSADEVRMREISGKFETAYLSKSAGRDELVRKVREAFATRK